MHMDDNISQPVPFLTGPLLSGYSFDLGKGGHLLFSASQWNRLPEARFMIFCEATLFQWATERQNLLVIEFSSLDSWFFYNGVYDLVYVFEYQIDFDGHIFNLCLWPLFLQGCNIFYYGVMFLWNVVLVFVSRFMLLKKALHHDWSQCLVPMCTSASLVTPAWNERVSTLPSSLALRVWYTTLV